MLPKTLAITLLVTSLFAADPEKLTKLRSSYESAMAKAAAPIQKTYTTELQRLKIEFTKAGDLEAALAIDAEMNRISGTPEATTTASKGPLADLVGSTWAGTGPAIGTMVTFKADGVVEALDKGAPRGAWQWGTDPKGNPWLKTTNGKPSPIAFSHKGTRMEWDSKVFERVSTDKKAP